MPSTQREVHIGSDSVSTVTFDDDRAHVLLMLREDVRHWTLPGGRIEPGETQEAAAVRETFEETGYVVQLDGFVGTYTRLNMPGGGDTKYIFRGHVTGGTPIQRGPETRGVRWFPIVALPRRLVIPRFTRQYIADALANAQVPAAPPVTRTQHIARWRGRYLSFLLWLRDQRNRLTGHP